LNKPRRSGKLQCQCPGRGAISYLAELRTNWRALFAATFGLGTGSSAIALYTTSVIAPHMIADLGWTKATFAALGTLSIVPSLCFPVAGRLADLFGVRRTALIGILILPLGFLAYSLMTGAIWQYAAIYLVVGVLGITTSTTIYSRIAVQYVTKARGLALAIVASGPAFTGIFASALVNKLIEAEGWRTTFHVLALYAAVAGTITLLLLPGEKKPAAGIEVPKRRAREDYPLMFRTPVFWILLVAMLLCNLPQIVAMSQLKMVLVENGIDPQNTTVMLAALPFGVLVGRFAAGLALDRFPAHLVGFLGTGLPSIGLLLFTSNIDAPAVLTLAVLSIGFSVGAEGDILAFIVARKFGVDIYSSVMGLMTMAISFSVALGAALLSLTLRLTGTFNAYLLICAAAVFAGSLLFLFVGKQNAPEIAAQPA
jgi:predicted MFS family arabinose efflux permease